MAILLSRYLRWGPLRLPRMSPIGERRHVNGVGFLEMLHYIQEKRFFVESSLSIIRNSP
jgi:hypothetical protein